VTTSSKNGISPQARGRELASLGRTLWAETGSVQAAAAELMHRYRDVPSLQAYRYAAGLSQDQAAARYNEVTGVTAAVDAQITPIGRPLLGGPPVGRQLSPHCCLERLGPALRVALPATR
jgi:hypothetical protein